MYRPEGYINPYREHLLDLDFMGNPSIANKVRFEEFEAGASAMLEALRKEGEYINNNGLSPYGLVLAKTLERGQKGYIVFIPDEEE